MIEPVTERLLLRRWREEDRDAFAALAADPEVMRWYPAVWDRADSDAFVDRVSTHLAEHGWGLWALEELATGRFLGYTGLWPPAFMPDAVEVGWRLRRDAWGHGFATEAARAAIAVGFGELGLPEIVSFTAVGNARSRMVMERLGMTHDPADDFDHPSLAEDSPLRRHVLYRLPAPS